MLQPQLYNNKNHLIPIIKIWDQVILLPNHNILLIYHLQIYLQLIITHPYKTFHFKSNHLLLFFIYFIFHNLSFYLLVFHFVVSLIHSQTNKKPCIFNVPNCNNNVLFPILRHSFNDYYLQLVSFLHPQLVVYLVPFDFFIIIINFFLPLSSSIFHVIFREFYSVFLPFPPFLELNFI